MSQTSDGRRTTVDHTHRRDLYLAARPSRINGLITTGCDAEYLACAEPLSHAGLSAAAETLVFFSYSATCLLHFIVAYSIVGAPECRMVGTVANCRLID